MKRIFLPLLIISCYFLPFRVAAAGLQIEEVTLYQEEGNPCVLLTLRWKHAWRNERNHDGVWLFFKTKKENGWEHVRPASEGHRVVDELAAWPASLQMEVPEDGIGVFLFPGVEFRGEVHATVSVRLQEGRQGSVLRAFGQEMVFIPGGPNTLGDPDTTALACGAFYRAGDRGQYGGLLEVTRQAQEIPVGAEAGMLYYRPNAGPYAGDGRGPVPAAFPKGVAPFWIMKYELTEGQYVDFLNTLTPEQARYRNPVEAPGYEEAGGSIRFQGGRWLAVYPERPCGFLGWKDLLAYADWAGLRPMTELEYTKACRGARDPVAGAYAWGTSVRRYLQRGLDEKGFLQIGLNLTEAQLDFDRLSLSTFGASYYRVMDLSDCLWEWVVSAGHPEGRAFTGRHGDGRLAKTGDADTPGWPMENGFGFRGSGYYLEDDPLRLRVYSPVADRPFAALNDPQRCRWAGGRLVRGW
jgi:formylglycine-generating enzyme required for sulfatase activity